MASGRRRSGGTNCIAAALLTVKGDGDGDGGGEGRSPCIPSAAEVTHFAVAEVTGEITEAQRVRQLAPVAGTRAEDCAPLESLMAPVSAGEYRVDHLATLEVLLSVKGGISKNPIFVPGVWGPYFSAMVPGFWLNEGGQSVTGKLIDHMVQGHAAFPELQAKATARCQSIYAYLNSHLDLIKKTQPVGFLTVDLHVWPDFHGNRSPLADLTLKGMVTGLKLSQDLDDLAILYLATVQAIAFGTRLIIEAMESAGHSISTLFLCGGLGKNPLFVQMHADITGMPVVLSQEVESVLVGAAILGACASGDFASVQEAMARMSKVGKVVFPRREDKRYYDKKYQVFLKLVEHQKEYASIMKGD
nr:FGGY carbohydrate kinase domain-containing protein-like [Delphinus delphis]